MNLSGIAVVAAPADIDAVVHALAALPGMQVMRVDRDSGRIVLVQEAPAVADEIEGFRAIQRTRGVISADLVCHYFGDQALPDPDLGTVLERLGPTTDSSPRTRCDSACDTFFARGPQ
jgi:nitrate reductase NapAB chaperone NapD